MFTRQATTVLYCTTATFHVCKIQMIAFDHRDTKQCRGHLRLYHPISTLIDEPPST